jgi:hypothetical protein
MTRAKKIRGFFLFVLAGAVVVIVSNRLVEISGEKASRRSEYAVMDRLTSRQTDAGDSALVKEFNEQVIRELHRHFHHLPEVKEIDTGHQSQCLMCHSLLPHSKNEKIRVMLNMHSDFLNCETCHYQKQRDQIRYRWFDMGIDNDITRGSKFGTHYDEETGLLDGTENHISKITPALGQGDKSEILFMAQSHPMAQDYIQVKDRLTPGQREQAKKKFHGGIESKGWACRECHKKEGVLDLGALGFSERRAREIENLEIVGMFDKYEVFHLPKW